MNKKIEYESENDQNSNNLANKLNNNQEIKSESNNKEISNDEKNDNADSKINDYEVINSASSKKEISNENKNDNAAGKINDYEVINSASSSKEIVDTEKNDNADGKFNDNEEINTTSSNKEIINEKKNDNVDGKINDYEVINSASSNKEIVDTEKNDNADDKINDNEEINSPSINKEINNDETTNTEKNDNADGKINDNEEINSPSINKEINNDETTNTEKNDNADDKINDNEEINSASSNKVTINDETTNKEKINNNEVITDKNNIDNNTQQNIANVQPSRTQSTPFVYSTPKNNNFTQSSFFKYIKSLDKKQILIKIKKYRIHYIILAIFYLIFLLLLVFNKYRIVYITILIIISLLIPKYRSYAVIITISLFTAIIFFKKGDLTMNEFIGLPCKKPEQIKVATANFIYENKYLVNVNITDIQFTNNKSELHQFTNYVKSNMKQHEIDLYNGKFRREFDGFLISLNLVNWHLISSNFENIEIDKNTDSCTYFIEKNRGRIHEVVNTQSAKYKKKLATLFVVFSKTLREKDEVITENVKDVMKKIVSEELFRLMIFE